MQWLANQILEVILCNILEHVGGRAKPDLLNHYSVLCKQYFHLGIMNMHIISKDHIRGHQHGLGFYPQVLKHPQGMKMMDVTCLGFLTQILTRTQCIILIPCKSNNWKRDVPPITGRKGKSLWSN